MTCRIIAVACEKGGAAKTTTAILLAQELMRHGQQVVVLDADVSGGATTWSQMAEESGSPLPFQVITANLPKLKRARIEAMMPDGWVFIDTPPSDTAVLQAAINAADLTIIPTQPGTADLVLAGETYMAAHAALILLTRVRKHTLSARNAAQELEEGNIGRFDTIISEREEIRRLYCTSRRDRLEYPVVALELQDVFKNIEEEK